MHLLPKFRRVLGVVVVLIFCLHVLLPGYHEKVIWPRSVQSGQEVIITKTLWSWRRVNVIIEGDIVVVVNDAL